MRTLHTVSGVRQDKGKGTTSQKVARDKPKELTDRCYNGTGTKVSDALSTQGMPLSG